MDALTLSREARILEAILFVASDPVSEESVSDVTGF